MAVIVTLSGIACMYVDYHFVTAAFLTWAVIYNMVKFGNKKDKKEKK